MADPIHPEAGVRRPNGLEMAVLARKLREAKAAVERELSEHGARGELRQNDQMPSWPAYVEAEAAWNDVLARYMATA